MGKLLKLQLKENLKILFWIWLIPLALSTGFILLNRNVDNTFTQVGLAISIFLLFFGLGASLIIVIYQDYQRFFGKEAIFYQSLPVAPGANVWSRFFSYFVSIILIVFVLFFDFWIISIASGTFLLTDLKLSLDLIGESLRQVPLGYVISFALLILTSIAFEIYDIILSINLGSQKSFKSMGFFGPILMYVLLKVLLQVIILIVISQIRPGMDSYLVEVSSAPDPATFTETMDLFGPIFYGVIGFNLVMTGIFAAISTYLQNKKLSVG